VRRFWELIKKTSIKSKFENESQNQLGWYKLYTKFLKNILQNTCVFKFEKQCRYVVLDNISYKLKEIIQIRFFKWKP
jgi:predicted metal-binding protein